VLSAAVHVIKIDSIRSITNNNRSHSENCFEAKIDFIITR